MGLPQQTSLETESTFVYQQQFKDFCDFKYAAQPDDKRYNVSEDKLFFWLKDDLLVREKRSGLILADSTRGLLSLKDAHVAKTALVKHWRQQVFAHTNSHLHPAPLGGLVMKLLESYAEVNAERLSSVPVPPTGYNIDDSSRSSVSPAASTSDSEPVKRDVHTATKDIAPVYKTYQRQFLEFCATHCSKLPEAERSLVTEEKLYKWLADDIAVRRSPKLKRPNGERLFLTAGTMINAKYALCLLWKVQVGQGINFHSRPTSDRINQLIKMQERRNGANTSKRHYRNAAERSTPSDSLDSSSRGYQNPMNKPQGEIRAIHQESGLARRDTQEMITKVVKSQSSINNAAQHVKHVLRGDCQHIVSLNDGVSAQMANAFDASSQPSTPSVSFSLSATHDEKGSCPPDEFFVISSDDFSSTHENETPAPAMATWKRRNDIGCQRTGQSKRLRQWDGSAIAWRTLISESSESSERPDFEAYRAALQGALEGE